MAASRGLKCVYVNMEMRDGEMDLCPEPQLGSQQSSMSSLQSELVLYPLWSMLLSALQRVAGLDVQAVRPLTGYPTLSTK